MFNSSQMVQKKKKKINNCGIYNSYCQYNELWSETVNIKNNLMQKTFFIPPVGWCT